MNFFYTKLGLGRLTDCSRIALTHPRYRGLEKIGADKVYFSGGLPAILFKEVLFFDERTLRGISEIQRKAWNYRKVMFLYVLSDTEIRVYNCYEKPVYLTSATAAREELKLSEIFRTQANDVDGLNVLVELFSQVGVDCGLLWTSDLGILEKIDTQKTVDRFLAQSLLKTAQILNEEIQDKDVVHSLLMRSLFILYLEDRGAAKEAWIYSRIKQGTDCYFDILEDVDATYVLFEELHNHFQFNLFPVTEYERQTVTKEHLQKIRNCFTCGETPVKPVAYGKWRIFDFSLIQTEVLSEVYETFIEEFKNNKNNMPFYTPYPLVELMLNDKLPAETETNHNVRTLDIACGAGIFLVESYKRLIQRWKNANPGRDILFTELRDILIHNIFGIDIDPLALKVSASLLYLTLLEYLDPKTLWLSKEYRLPYMMRSPNDHLLNNQGINLWCGDAIGEIDAEKFLFKADLLVGNPPFGTDKISPEIKNYLDKQKYAQEKVLAFMDKATQFVNDEGQIAMIFNTKILTNTNKSYQNFRKWLFNKTYVEKIYNLSIFNKAKKDFAGQLFNSASIPVSIACYRKTFPGNVLNIVEYFAPQTYIKSNLADGLVIDSVEVKFLPRYECQVPDTKIWKTAMWGNVLDFNLLSLLSDKSTIYLKSYFKENNWLHATGLNGDSKHKDFAPDLIIETKEIQRYYTPEDVAVPNDKYFRKIDKHLFRPPFIVVKKGQNDNREVSQVTASYIDYTAYFKSGVFIMNKNDDNCSDIKKCLVAFFNSDLATYYLFLSTSSWGIERDQIMLNEYLELPAFFNDTQDLSAIAKLFDELVSELKQEPKNPLFVKQKEEEINRKLESLIGLTAKEQILIQDTLKFSLNLLEQGENSIGFEPVSKDENEAYAIMITEEMNEVLQHSSYKVNAVIYDVPKKSPLNLVTLSIITVKKDIIFKSSDDLTLALKTINTRMLRQQKHNIYVKQQYKYFDNNFIYIIKPNRKYFWTRSQAMNDAMLLITEIAKMKSNINGV
ncbi:MAG: SAM-dependent methyltransferase [Prevotellaceae bacterium]|jgi:predicted RNA methylase|nr:SAM-dependent methyltransferase [Prevotellaceae bacterium]